MEVTIHVSSAPVQPDSSPEEVLGYAAAEKIGNRPVYFAMVTTSTTRMVGFRTQSKDTYLKLGRLEIDGQIALAATLCEAFKRSPSLNEVHLSFLYGNGVKHTFLVSVLGRFDERPVSFRIEPVKR